MDIRTPQVPLILLLMFGLVVSKDVGCKKDDIVENLCKQKWSMCAVRGYSGVMSLTEIKQMENCTLYLGNMFFKIDQLYKRYGENIRQLDLERYLRHLRLVCGTVYVDKHYNIENLPFAKTLFEISANTFASVSSECGDTGLLRVLRNEYKNIETLEESQKVLRKEIKTLEEKLEKSEESRKSFERKNVHEEERKKFENLKVLKKIANLQTRLDKSEESFKTTQGLLYFLITLVIIVILVSIAHCNRYHFNVSNANTTTTTGNGNSPQPQPLESQSEMGSRGGQLNDMLLKRT